MPNLTACLGAEHQLATPNGHGVSDFCADAGDCSERSVETHDRCKCDDYSRRGKPTWLERDRFTSAH